MDVYLLLQYRNITYYIAIPGNSETKKKKIVSLSLISPLRQEGKCPLRRQKIRCRVTINW